MATCWLAGRSHTLELAQYHDRVSGVPITGATVTAVIYATGPAAPVTPVLTGITLLAVVGAPSTYRAVVAGGDVLVVGQTYRAVITATSAHGPQQFPVDFYVAESHA